MSEPVIIKLDKPITFGSRTVEQLTIRPVKAKDLRHDKDTDSGMVRTLAMLSRLSGEPSQVIDELEGNDLKRALKAVNDFLFAIQETGETP